MNLLLITFIITLSLAADASCNKKMDVKHQTQPTSKTGGPTSLAMVMTYFGTSTTGQEVCSWLGNCNRDTGTDFSEMLDAAKHYGFSEAVWKYGVSELQSSIANGVPVVAIINIQAGSYPMLADGSSAYNSFTGGAYIEIHGIHCDSNGNIDYYIVNDPSQDGWADRKYTYDSMKTAWGNRDYRYLSVKEKGEAPGSTESSTAPAPTPKPESSAAPAPEPQPDPAPTPSYDENTVKLNVAHLVQPTKTSGGPTSLAMIMNYHGKSLTGKDVCTYIGNCDDTAGTDFNQMLDAAKHYGFNDASKQAGTSYFKKAVDDDVPVVAIINVEPNSYPKLTNGSYLNGLSGGHYIEIHGYHLDANKKIDYYIANDPFQKGWKDLQLTASSMDTAWGDRDYEFVVVKKFDGQSGDGAVPDPNSCTKKMEVAHQAQPTSYSCGPTSLAMAMVLLVRDGLLCN